MLNIAICDDNLLFAQQANCEIKKILKDNHIEYNVAVFQTGRRLIDAGFFDIVFLDIEMQGLSGLETAEKLRKQSNNCRIIFLTSHRKYVFSAFDVSASHYLLKPLDIVKLKSVIMKIVDEFTIQQEQCCTVKRGTEVHRVPFSQIKFVEVFGRKISLHTQDEIFTFNGRLEELEKTLPKSFFRCHKSYILNLAEVRKYDKETAILQSGNKVPIARRKFAEFGKEFLAFLREKGGM